MLTFHPKELEERIKTALLSIAKTVDDTDFEFVEDGFNPATDDFDPAEFEDLTITTESTLKISLPRCDDSLDISYGGLLNLASELEKAEIVRNVECWTPTRFLLRVAPLPSSPSRQLFESLYAGDAFSDGMFVSESVVNGRRINCSLVAGYTPFAFLVTSQCYWDKHYPPILSDDLFLQACFDKGTDRALVRQIAVAYQFELSATLSVNLQQSPRAEASDFVFEDEETDAWEPPPLRPLLIGSSLTPLLQLFNKAVVAGDPEVCLLYLTKCFEYVAQTVVRQQLVETMCTKLMSPRALNPSADFILEVESLLDEQRTFRRDKEAVILTAIQCCEATELAPHAPPFLDSLTKVTGKTKRKDREESMRQFATALVATRNSIAHAKANYEPTGEESPDSQLHAFAECARIAAQQVVRWYADRPDSSRVS